MRPALAFPHPSREVLVRRLREIPLVGRVIAPKSAIACSICSRRIEALGRLPCPGYPTCDHLRCETTRMGALTPIFRGSPYGSALTRTTVGTFARILDLPNGQVLVQRQPVVERAEILAEGFVALLSWQEAYDAWERFVDPVGYREGRVRVPPPRRLDDVLAIRAAGMPVVVDPTLGLDAPARALIARFRDEGEEAVRASLGETALRPA